MPTKSYENVSVPMAEPVTGWFFIIRRNA